MFFFALCIRFVEVMHRNVPYNCRLWVVNRCSVNSCVVFVCSIKVIKDTNLFIAVFSCNIWDTVFSELCREKKSNSEWSMVSGSKDSKRWREGIAGGPLLRHSFQSQPHQWNSSLTRLANWPLLRQNCGHPTKDLPRKWWQLPRDAVVHSMVHRSQQSRRWNRWKGSAFCRFVCARHTYNLHNSCLLVEVQFL